MKGRVRPGGVVHAPGGAPAPPALGPDAIGARLRACVVCAQREPGGLCAGCFCALEARAARPDGDCPLGKWPGPAAPAPGVVR